jgi:signal transduction histidine kinase
MFVREKYMREIKFLAESVLLVELLLSITIIYMVNLSYKGILLLVIINILTYTESSRKKFIFTAVIMAIYIFFDHDLLSKQLSLISLNEYIAHFSPMAQLYIYGIKSILTSLNEILFILFLVLAAQKQIEEKKEIRELFSKLVKTTEELRVANVQLNDYVERSEEMAKTKERNRLAREIHDTIGHTLTGIVTGLEACKTLMRIDIERAVKQIDKISELGRNGLLDVRRSVKELRPDALERFSLIPALTRMINDINECTNTKIGFDVSGDFSRLCPDEEEAVYRTIQESITNSVRHGNAKNIAVALSEADNVITLSIEDDGIGSPVIEEGFGLKHIRERIELLKGKVLFKSGEKGGFLVSIFLTIRNHK